MKNVQYKADILIPEVTYHIYNRANGNERLFMSTENYRYFLQKYREHISPIAHTFCYCLMPNHFHILIRIKREEELRALEAFPKFETLEKLLSKQFSNFFSAYTQAFNKHYKRKGSLFMKNFKRKAVRDEAYLKKLVRYIHHNPVEARLCAKPEDWKHSSYALLLNGKTLLPERDELIRWFGDLDNFIYCHYASPDISGINP